MSDVNLMAMTDDELIAHRAGLMRSLAQSLFQLRSGQLQNTSTLKSLRRDIARANTELRSREVVQGVVKGSLQGRTVGKRGEDSGAGEKVRRSRFGLGPIRDAIVSSQSR